MKQHQTLCLTSALWSAAWIGDIRGTSKALFYPHRYCTVVGLLLGQGAWEQAYMAAGGNHIPQTHNSSLLQLPFHTHSLIQTGMSLYKDSPTASLSSFPPFKGRQKRLENFMVSCNRPSPGGDWIISAVSYSEISTLLCIYFRQCLYGLLNQHALRSLSASPTAQILFLQFSVSCHN